MKWAGPWGGGKLCSDSRLSWRLSDPKVYPWRYAICKGRDGQEFTLSSEPLNFHRGEGVDIRCFYLLCAFLSLFIFIYPGKVIWAHKHTFFFISALRQNHTALHDSSGSPSVYFSSSFYSLQEHGSWRSGLRDLLKGSYAALTALYVTSHKNCICC